MKISIIAALVCVMPLCALPVRAQYGGGSGTVEDPYLIYTAEQMNAIGADSNDWDKHFKLGADIDLEGYSATAFNIIGTGHLVCNTYGQCTFFRTPFTGIFDGDGFEIHNFNYIATDSDFIECIGLFGVVEGPDAEIKNLGLIGPNVDVEPGDGVASLVGYLVMGTVTGCYVQAGNVSADYRAGGLVGQSGDGALISECYATGNVSGHAELGGLLGSGYYSTVSNCYSDGSVNGSGLFAGGLVGGNYYGTILECYSTCSVWATSWYGGLVGENRGSIYHCYSNGEVIGAGSHIGGLVGWGGGAMESFWDTQTSGQTSSNDGTGKTTAEMQDPNTYLDAGWDFTTPIWKMCDVPDYPRLWWECPPPVEAEVQIRPKAMNLRSNGRWINCHIRLPGDNNVADVEPNSVVLENEPNDIYAEWIWFEEEDEVAMAKFSRSEVQEMLSVGEVELTVTGQLIDGTYFEGTDTIKVIDKGRPIHVNSNSIVKDGIEYYIQTDKRVYKLGEQVQMLYRVTNLRDEDVTFSFPHFPVWNFWVEKDGEYIWRAVNLWFETLTELTLSPGESKEFPHPDHPRIWNMKDRENNLVIPGKYNVFGGLYAGCGSCPSEYFYDYIYDYTKIAVPIKIIRNF